MKKKRRLLQSDLFWGLGAALLVLLQFWWLPGEDGAAADSYSTTVDGKLGLFRTLSELFPVVERDAIKVVPDDPATMILIAPDRYPNEEEQQQLYEFVYNGGDLLFAPNWLSRDWSDPLKAVPSISIPSLGIKFDYRPNADVTTASSLKMTPAPATSSNPATPHRSRSCSRSPERRTASSPRSGSRSTTRPSWRLRWMTPRVRSPDR